MHFGIVVEVLLRLTDCNPVASYGTVVGVPTILENTALALDRLSRGAVAVLADNHPRSMPSAWASSNT